MVVDDDFIQVRVVAAAILGVFRALVLGVGAECLFSGDWDKSWSRIRHGDGSLTTRNCGLLCDVVWTLILREKIDESNRMPGGCPFLLLQPALPSSCFENGGPA